MSQLRRARLARLAAGACVALLAAGAPSMAATTPEVPGLEAISDLIPQPRPDAPRQDPGEVAAADAPDEQGSAEFGSSLYSDAPAQDPAPSAATSLGDLAARVVDLTNRDRAAAGCLPLTPQGLLAESAQGHADEMARKVYFSHASLDGRTFDQRIRDTGYEGRELGENIASGFATADEVQEAWMATPAHRKNILDCAFREIGVGFASDGQYWVVNFGG